MNAETPPAFPATHPDHRRRGLVQALLAAILERGRQLGATRAADIGVMIGNDRAQWAYERAGFRVGGENGIPTSKPCGDARECGP